MGFCDLHMHSTASDGATAPADLARLARDRGVEAIALTDHDTTAGLVECEEACRRLGVKFAPGIEVSADPHDVAAQMPELPAQTQLGTLHILGLFVRHDDPMLAQIHQRMRDARNQRNPGIVAKLQGLGVRIEYAEVEALATKQGTAIIGRPHIAQVLQQKGYVKSIQDAFARYIGQGAPAYVRRDRLPPRQAIEAIHHAGGLAVFAHPVQLRLERADHLEYFVKVLQTMGLDALETRHRDHTAAQVDALARLAAKYKLLVSGGSDYHGSRSNVELGSQNVPMAVFEQLQAAWKERNSRVSTAQNGGY